MYWIIGGIFLVVVLFIVPSRVMAKRIRKIQEICTNSYSDFEKYVNTYSEFSLSDEKYKDSLRITYYTPKGIQTKYLTYFGKGTLDKALDELIAHFN